MNARMLWSRVLVIVGGIAMMLGTLDPLEGSPLILLGSGMVALACGSVSTSVRRCSAGLGCSS